MFIRPRILDAISRAPGRVILKNATAPRCFLDPSQTAAGGQDVQLVDITLADGLIAAIAPAGSDGEHPQIDLHQAMVWPCFTDCHTHLDKGHSWDRSENQTGDFDGALAAIGQDYQHWSADDLRRRMTFGIETSFVRGTSRIRTHLDTVSDMADTAWGVFDELRADWAGRVDLQAAALTVVHQLDEARAAQLKHIMRRHQGVPGMVCYASPELPEKLDMIFRIAMDLGSDLDFHVDETLDPAARSLEAIADTALKLGFEGRVICGHCCSLSQQADDDVARVIDKVSKASLSIVSLPMCNLYLQDRHPARTPRARGVTLLHEFAAANVAVAAASDNCRDGFYAYGDHDLLEVFTQTVRLAHLDCPVGDWPKMATTTPAEMMGIKTAHLSVGAPADMIIFPGRRYSELLSRSQHERIVLRRGAPITQDAPSYHELDDLV